jgi:hypothetical protein
MQAAALRALAAYLTKHRPLAFAGVSPHPAPVNLQRLFHMASLASDS